MYRAHLTTSGIRTRRWWWWTQAVVNPTTTTDPTSRCHFLVQSHCQYGKNVLRPLEIHDAEIYTGIAPNYSSALKRGKKKICVTDGNSSDDYWIGCTTLKFKCLFLFLKDFHNRGLLFCWSELSPNWSVLIICCKSHVEREPFKGCEISYNDKVCVVEGGRGELMISNFN